MNAKAVIGWVGGIVASLIVGLLIWKFTHAGGWWNPEKPPDPLVPHVEFLSCNGYSTSVGDKPTGTFDIINNGTGNARQCRIKWFPGPKAGWKQVRTGTEYESAKSEYFGLVGNERRSITMTGLPYREISTYMSYAHIECDGSDAIMNACSLQISVKEKSVPPQYISGYIIDYTK